MTKVLAGIILVISLATYLLWNENAKLSALNQAFELRDQEQKLAIEFLTKVEKDQGQVVFLAMSVPDYELMAYNMQELKRYINELKEVVVYYKTVTTKKGE